MMTFKMAFKAEEVVGAEYLGSYGIGRKWQQGELWGRTGEPLIRDGDGLMDLLWLYRLHRAALEIARFRI